MFIVEESLWVAIWIGVAICAFTFTAVAWILRAFDSQFYLILFPVLTAGCVLYVGLRMRNLSGDSRKIQLGVQGEESVASILEDLRGMGYRALHDITEDGFNIDHVLVGPGGVFAVETKTVQKPMKGNPSIRHHNGKIIIEGVATTEDPLRQVKGAAKHVRELLKRETGRSVYVQPVLLYPGWWVDERSSPDDVWLLNPGRFGPRLVSEIQKRKPMPEEDIHLYISRLQDRQHRA